LLDGFLEVRWIPRKNTDDYKLFRVLENRPDRENIIAGLF